MELTTAEGWLLNALRNMGASEEEYILAMQVNFAAVEASRGLIRQAVERALAEYKAEQIFPEKDSLEESLNKMSSIFAHHEDGSCHNFTAIDGGKSYSCEDCGFNIFRFDAKRITHALNYSIKPETLKRILGKETEDSK